ncbi:unnamed protein product [Amoebophrya sp. A120]|nr:unnamed protein product [Amoebophrya sp. A120]|eukprot:GSA120T00019132001.1
MNIHFEHALAVNSGGVSVIPRNLKWRGENLLTTADDHVLRVFRGARASDKSENATAFQLAAEYHCGEPVLDFCWAHESRRRESPEPGEHRDGNALHSASREGDDSHGVVAPQDEVSSIQAAGIDSVVAAEAGVESTASGPAADHTATIESSGAESLKVGDTGKHFKFNSDPSSNSPRFFVSCRGRPIHLMGFTDEAGDEASEQQLAIIGSYPGYNNVDEVTHAFSLATSSTHIFGGYESAVRMFDVNRPGYRNRTELLTSTRKRNFGKDSPHGIIGALSFNEATQALCVGSYNGQIAVYDPFRSRNMVWKQEIGTNPEVRYNRPATGNSKAAKKKKVRPPRELLRSFCEVAPGDEGNSNSSSRMGGITQLEWIDEYCVLSGHRKDHYLRFWDLRMNQRGPVYRLPRSSMKTSQRLQFCVTDYCCMSGDDQGNLHWYRLDTGECVRSEFLGAEEVVSGCDWSLESPFIATCQGSRKFVEDEAYEVFDRRSKCSGGLPKAFDSELLRLKRRRVDHGDDVQNTKSMFQQSGTAVSSIPEVCESDDFSADPQANLFRIWRMGGQEAIAAPGKQNPHDERVRSVDGDAHALIENVQQETNASQQNQDGSGEAERISQARVKTGIAIRSGCVVDAATASSNIIESSNVAPCSSILVGPSLAAAGISVL